MAVVSEAVAQWLRAMFLYSLARAKPVQVTDGMSDCAKPVFDRQGKYLYFLASTDFGPSREIDVLKTKRRVTSSVYLMVLSRHRPSPPGPGRSEGAAPAEPRVLVDLEDIGRRAVPLPMPPRRYSALEVGTAGVVFVAERVEETRLTEIGLTIHRFDLARRQVPQPTGVIAGPKVMIINEFSGSGGDLLPWYFRRARAGKLVGKRTWGGVVGLWDRTPPLLDGGFLVIPSGLSWNPDGTWDLENVGVPPDIEVEQDPRLVRQGRDPQLERAIEVVLNELRRKPALRPTRPQYPRGAR